MSQTGVRSQDHIRITVADGFKIQTVHIIKNIGSVNTQFLEGLVCPGMQIVFCYHTIVGGRNAYGSNAECQRRVLVFPANGGDALRFALDDGFAVGMLDRDGIFGFLVCSGDSAFLRRDRLGFRNSFCLGSGNSHNRCQCQQGTKKNG